MMLKDRPRAPLFILRDLPDSPHSAHRAMNQLDGVAPMGLEEDVR